jgi:SAM-dependent methyltransferase
LALASQQSEDQLSFVSFRLRRFNVQEQGNLEIEDARQCHQCHRRHSLDAAKTLSRHVAFNATPCHGDRRHAAYGYVPLSKVYPQRFTRAKPLHSFHEKSPQLEVLANLLNEYDRGSTLRVASIGCGTGAELYSALHAFRRARLDLKILAQGADISEAVVEVARDAARRGIGGQHVRQHR